MQKTRNGLSAVQRSLLAATAMATLATSALGNDSAMGGSGADLVPLDQSTVRLDREDILLVYENDAFTVTADYLFVNETDKPAKVQVGFPEIICDPNGEQDCVNAGFRDFKTLVNGKAVELRKGSIEQDHEWAEHLGTVWLFDVTFAARQQTRIHHSYKVNPGQDVEDNRFTTYVTRSGATWAANISEARFTVRLPPETHTVYDTLGPPRLVDANGARPYVELQRLKTNWEPDDDLFIEFNASPYGHPVLGKDRLTRSGVSEAEECTQITVPESAAQKQMCKNTLYALGGYPFKNPKLRQYFYGEESSWQLLPPAYAEDDPEVPRVWRRGYQEYPGRDPQQIVQVFSRFFRELDSQQPPAAAGTDEAALREPQPSAPQASASPAQAGAASAAQPAPKASDANASRSHCLCTTRGSGEPAPVWPFVLSFGLWVRRRRRR